ncbi:MAG: cytochrome c maturation protein CcmE [Actinomycetia bacterium]|nr:cytochrome c maturation protein CcmE [Actinomycetes bacterium]
MESDQSSDLDLSPRTELDDAESIRRELRKGRSRWVGVVGVLVVVALGFLVVQFLRDATLFFRNVDEAVAERDELGDRRFRLQGRVIPDTVEFVGDSVVFEIEHECVFASVRHVGDPPELFEKPWIPVVLEGSWEERDVELPTGTDDHQFVSDRMIVKHTNEYAAENSERVEVVVPADYFAECGIAADS